ncbi:MAG: glycoside hydrolase family 3 protein [Pricia sp.]|nr:glycoside hydrolase family 3 protein [Pricia sp.]
MSKIFNYHQASDTLTPSEKIGQLFMPAAFINDSEEEIQRLEKIINEHHVGGLCFFHSRASAATNFEGKKVVVHNERSYDTLCQLIKRYQKSAKYPLIIAIDAEWGLAMRIENTPQYPYAITLGALQENNELIFKVGKNIAKDCRAVGIHWNLAPCVDINNNPDNPVIGYRSFGETKEKVVTKAIAFIEGIQSEGVYTSVKHFPGHGDTATDSHLGLPLITKSKNELLENELYPFKKLIDKGIDSVMIGHLSVPSLAEGERVSSSISKRIIKGVLRQEMGFTGVVISDALNMHAVSKNYAEKGELEWLAFDAGNDVLCFAINVKEGIDRILKNASKKQIEESFQRVWKLKERTILSSSENGGTHLTDPDNLNREIATKSLTLLKGSEKDLHNFRQTNFKGISISKNIDNQFFKSIQQHKKFKHLSSTVNPLNKEEYVLLALYPPEVKPTNNFGYSETELADINELIRTKTVIIYLFGNPYLLRLIDTKRALAVVVAYQNFNVFQEVAANHFLGEFTARGKMPVSF